MTQRIFRSFEGSDAAAGRLDQFNSFAAPSVRDLRSHFLTMVNEMSVARATCGS